MYTAPPPHKRRIGTRAGTGNTPIVAALIGGGLALLPAIAGA